MNPSLALHPIIKRILENCFQDWVNWKTQDTMLSVDKQAEDLKKQWQAEDNAKVVEKAQEMFPEAKVSLHDETGAVLIEHPPDGSHAQDLLGGAMEIRAPWTLIQDSTPEK